MFHDDMYGHVPNRRKPLATASLIFGILSIVLCSVIYLALPLGALAVILAILSHTEYKMAGKSRTGLLCGICGMIATIVVTVSAFYYVLTDPTALAYLNYYMQIYTGDETFDLGEELGSLLPGYTESEENEVQPETEPDLTDLFEPAEPYESVPPVELPEEGGTYL